MRDRLKLNSICLSGYKSLSPSGQKIEFGNLTLLLGANGAGKSNLVSFFKMLNYMTTEALQTFVGEQGYADSLLYFGSKNTARITAELTFSNEETEDTDTYSFSLSQAAGDILIFTEEYVTWKQKGRDRPQKISLEAGHKESRLKEKAWDEQCRTCKFVYSLLRNCQVFQFHDTSSGAKIRKPGYIGDNDFLRNDAGNLAAFLFAMKSRQDRVKYYHRIVSNIQTAMPQFGEFVLRPSAANTDYIRLDWKEKESDYLFGPHQLSDGSLRFMALTTLLLQPVETIPRVLIIDEPELGLHPAAISALAAMMKKASTSCQIILATQSTRLVDEFTANDVVIVERDPTSQQTIFRRHDEQALSDWLERYSLSELWEKNVLGGRP